MTKQFQFLKKNLKSMLTNRKIDLTNLVEKQNNMFIQNVIYIKFLLKKNIKPIDVKNELEK